MFPSLLHTIMPCRNDTARTCWLGNTNQLLPSATSSHPGSAGIDEFSFKLEEAGWLLSWLWKRLGRPRVTTCMCGLAALEAGDSASGSFTEVRLLRWSFTCKHYSSKSLYIVYTQQLYTVRVKYMVDSEVE
jgi:hypothetical protein